MKCDTVTKSCLHWYQKDFYPSEPIFVPRKKREGNTSEGEGTEKGEDSEWKGGKELETDFEDDGIVLSLVNSEVTETDLFLLILDGKTFKELARAAVSTPSSIPAGFHGYFFDRHSSHATKY